MRDRLRRILMALFVVLLAAVFAVFFGQQQGTGSGDVAEVDGKRIRRDVFEAFRLQSERSLEGLMQGLSRNDQRQLVDHQTLDSLIRRSVFTRDAELLGLGVSDAELRAELHANPEFQQDGRFERELLEGLAANLGLSLGDLLEEMRTDIQLRKLQRFTTSPVRMSRDATRFELARRGAERSLRYAVARVADFEARTAVDEAAVQELIAKDPARVQAVYDARRAEFQRPEEAHAGHILFTGEDGEVRAKRALERLQAGEPFDKLARELSEDSATAPIGGELGWFPRGVMSAELDAVIFDQLETGKHSAPVKSDRGWHVIRLEAKRPAQDRSFADMSAELAREILVQERASELARDASSRVLETGRSSGDLEAAARAEGLPLSTTGLFKRSDSSVPGLEAIPGLIEVAFALDPARPVAPRVFEDGGQFYAIALGETREPAAEELEAQLDAETERFTETERERTSALWYRARRRQLEEGGNLTLFPIYDE
jgi:peptidyl-prolyl cis-trans isomerase D